MPTAKKLPSGSWRCLAYSHSVPVFDKNGRPIIDSKTQKKKMKRVYESFTSDDPTKRGKAVTLDPLTCKSCPGAPPGP